MIHRDVARRSSRLAKEIDRSLKLYVPDASYEISRQILEEQHCCIISGTPGAGKTMLARALCATYLQQGYALVDASMALQDLDRVWEDGGKQIFFVDDFLGQATLDDQRADSASRVLLQLFRDARDDPDKRIVPHDPRLRARAGTRVQRRATTPGLHARPMRGGGRRVLTP